uniref:Uncharacterized protein n=1 Tax=Attheya septentrionalis TaxID=420275 RepID=A0A7S2U4P3_9STRA|mmetsp:Transcript_10273/g.18665  ORF Transcript_10273/g.18665 Transcript_10273/m.18665 type:complete len:309 (+) Transcript_10273:68-994(+)
MADDEMLLSQDDTRSLWDELSHAESREIQSHRQASAGLIGSSSGGVNHHHAHAPVGVAAATQLRTTFAAALSSAAHVASTAAERAREGYQHLQNQQNQQQHSSSSSQTKYNGMHHSFHDLAEFGLLDPPSASQPSLGRPSARTNLEIDVVGDGSSSSSSNSDALVLKPKQETTTSSTTTTKKETEETKNRGRGNVRGRATRSPHNRNRLRSKRIISDGCDGCGLLAGIKDDVEVVDVGLDTTERTRKKRNRNKNIKYLKCPSEEPVEDQSCSNPGIKCDYTDAPLDKDTTCECTDEGIFLCESIYAPK